MSTDLWTAVEAGVAITTLALLLIGFDWWLSAGDDEDDDDDDHGPAPGLRTAGTA